MDNEQSHKFRYTPEVGRGCGFCNSESECQARMADGCFKLHETADIYRLGEAPYNAADPGYYRHDPIATALLSAVGLSRIYVLCTDYTASASELVINGLRGLDIEVRLIGSRTNGKNVGMEVHEKTFGDYEYEFSPITFYIANGKGESDYGNGFAPDVEVEDVPFYWTETDEKKEYHPLDWGDEENDMLLACALFWIEKDRKPVVVSTASTRAFDGLQPLELRSPAPVRVQDMLRLPDPEE